ncbi:MAG: methylase [Ferruginibacter sp.]|nr:methylase [Ferruginibacter sp.]
MLSNELKRKITTLWDKFWSGGIANPITAIEQISYLIFMKRLDQTDTEKVTMAEFAGDSYSSVFKGYYQPKGSKEKVKRTELRWNKFKDKEPGIMLEHINRFVFPFIKQLGGEDLPFAKHMQNAVFIMPKPSLLAEAIAAIDDIYKEIDKEVKEKRQSFQDTQGDLYEYLLNEIATAGKNGQFRTPRHIIQMICEVIDPKLGEKVCDPTCGTAGFLLGAFQHILTQHTPPKEIHIDENGFRRGSQALITNKKLRKALYEDTLYGYDFDTTMVRLGLMNLMLHGIEKPKIDYKDTLSKQFSEENMYDVILANPPFKGSIDRNDVSGTLSLETSKTELLFVNKIINMLRIGGRAAIIVPDGVLFGSSKAHQYLRKMLLYRCQLDGVISMPSGVFKPYASVSTAVLIFNKASNEDDVKHTEKVWFYNMQSDGYTLDDKRNKLYKTDDVRDYGDLQNIPTHFHKKLQEIKKDRKGKFFFVPSVEIEKQNFDLSINRYKETIYQEATYEPPKHLLKTLLDLKQR